ncbi:MAG TPA: hypothetical protein VNO21_17580 [Polyangiaceae bacterium]|nr:hypothetical protein [Polyangiaceae bacterium]
MAKLLSSFVRGRVHLHFRDAARAEDALATSGFAAATLHRPADFAGIIGPLEAASAARVRVVDAVTRRPK